MEESRLVDNPAPAPPKYVLIGPETPFIWRLALAAVITVALLGALYLARAVVLPVVLAVLFSFLLSPIVRFLHGLGLPQLLGAALVMATLLAGVGSAAVLLSQPAGEWFQRLPEAAAELQERLQGVIETVRRVSEATERIASGPGGRTQTVEVDSGWSGFLIGRTWQFFAGLAMMLFLLYFLLGTGHLFLRKLVRVVPRFGQKRLAVLLVRHIEHDVSRYLFTVAAINTGLGTVVAMVLYAMGMPNPALWGSMAAVLNFIPYLGPAVTLTVLTAVSLLTFEQLGEALLRPATFFALTTLEGQVVTPLILGQRLMLNPVVIFVSLIFWGWLWGIIGALIAVPLTMIVKILCDAIAPLRPVGEFLSR